MGQTFANLVSHVVFSTKDRTEWIKPHHTARLYAYIGEVLTNLDCTLIRAGGMPDHIHLLAKISQKCAPADVVRDLKANSSRILKREFSDLRRFAWQNGYGIFSVSESKVPDIRRYIDNQQTHHKRKSYKDEFLGMLAKHKMTYDPQYIWD